MNTTKMWGLTFIVMISLFKPAILLGQNYHYPELMVVPKASKTLKKEARHERSDTLTRYLPMQIAALSTILVGFRARSKTEDGGSSNTGIYGYTAIGSGIAFLGLSTLLGAIYSPYQDGMRAIKRVKTKGKIGDLERERLAEDALEDAGELAVDTAIFSVIINSTLTAAICSEAANDKDTYLMVAAGLGVVMSFIPLIFESRAEGVMKRHNDYKKRIYGPVASLGLFKPSRFSQVGPMLNLTYNF